MEFPEVGLHCAVDFCKQNDFLPFTCPHCSSIFCKNHFNIISHNCTACPENTVGEPGKSKGFTCQHESCKSSSPVQMNCVKCKKHYCLSHRYHGCMETSEEEVAKKLKQWEKPKVEFDAAKAAADAEINENLRKSKKVQMANKVQLMRLKGKAVGPKSIPTVDKRYFLIYPPRSSVKREPRAVFTCARWTVGKTIDSIADTLSLPNSNNLANSEKLRMFHHSDGHLVAEKMDTVLSELFSNSHLVDGQSVILEYSNQSKVDPSSYK